MLEISNLTAEFAIGQQIEPDDVETLRAAGFASILNARPDSEDGEFLRSEDAAQLAEAKGLAYAYSPTENHAVLDPDTADAFEQHLVALPKPIFAHCKSGTRAAILWALVAARHRDVEDVIATLRDAGQELEFLEQELRDSAAYADKSPLRLKDHGLLALGKSPLLGGRR